MTHISGQVNASYLTITCIMPRTTGQMLTRKRFTIQEYSAEQATKRGFFLKPMHALRIRYVQSAEDRIITISL